MTRSLLKTASLALTLALGMLSAQTANPKQPKLKGPKEQEAVMAIFSAQDPDGRIAAAMNLVTKFSESDYKATALYIAAFSYQQKGDLENAVVFAEKTLEADPKFYGAQIMIATSLAQRTKEFDLDREEKLGHAEKMAKDAQALLATAPKPGPNVTDEQWNAQKKDFMAQTYEALGMAAQVRKNWEVCAAQYQLAVENVSQMDPAILVRQADCQIQLKKYDEAIAGLDKALVDPNAVAAVKNAALQMKLKANGLKAQK